MQYERKSDKKAMACDMEQAPVKSIRRKLSNNAMRFNFEKRLFFCCQHTILHEGKKGKPLRSVHTSCLPRQGRDFKAFRCEKCNGIKEVPC